MSFTDIAYEALRKGKQELATLLLEYEPNISKKVPILLQMENYEKALEESLNSQNSNLLNMVIFKMVKSEQYSEHKRPALFQLMGKNAVSKQHLV